MGCGSSSETHVIIPTASSYNDKSELKKTPNTSLSATSQTSKKSRITSGASQNDAMARITNGTSETCSTVLQSSNEGKTSANPSIHSQDDTKHDVVIIWVDPYIDITEKNYHSSITKLQRIT
ncbi:unnamed protein product, partial [Rotaria sordida]